MSEPAAVSPADISTAADRIAAHLRTTPILTVDGAELDVPGTVTLKLEYLQHSGTFKARGATNFCLANDISAAGVAAASGGNHGAAVAWAARTLGQPATIFVPTISSPAKVARLRAYGAQVVQTGAVYAEALAACDEHREQTGATGVHAYEAVDVMAGAGTTGLEFQAQVEASGLDRLDTVLVACGGGGLVGGISSWLGPDTSVVACETETTQAFAEAQRAGQPVDVTVSGIAADALGASRIGTLAFDALSAGGAHSAVVTDEAVVEAQQALWDRFRIVVEPSAAVPIAALRSRVWTPARDDHTGVVICGANTALDGAGLDS